MKEVFNVDATLFGQFVAVDVLVANIWMAVLLFLASRAQAFDRWTGADLTAINALKTSIENYQTANARMTRLSGRWWVMNSRSSLWCALADAISSSTGAAGSLPLSHPEITERAAEGRRRLPAARAPQRVHNTPPAR